MEMRLKKQSNPRTNWQKLNRDLRHTTKKNVKKTAFEKQKQWLYFTVLFI